jgi:hypothetical protein
MLDDDDEDEPVIRKPPPDFHFEELHDVTPNLFIRVLAKRTCACLWFFLFIGKTYVRLTASAHTHTPDR